MNEKQHLGAGEARFDEVYRAYGDDVLRLAYFYLADRGQAEDVAQDVFLRFYARGGEVAPGKEKAWLMVSTVNRCRDLWRSAWARRVIHGDKLLLSLPAEEDCSLEEREEKEAVLRAVHALAPPFRDVVLLFYYKELTLEEIAEQLGISRGTAASRLARGREKIKRMLKGVGIDG